VVVELVKLMVLFGEVLYFVLVLVEFFVDGIDVDFGLVETTIVVTEVILIFFDECVEFLDLLTLFVKLIVCGIPLLIKSN
jgi:hypothetical protein